MEYVNTALALFQQGFDTVNSIQGLVIALGAAFLMRNASQVLAWSLISTVLHEIINTVRLISAGAPNPLPNLADVDGDLKLIGIRYVGYMLAIIILFALRRLFLRR